MRGRYVKTRKGIHGNKITTTTQTLVNEIWQVWF